MPLLTKNRFEYIYIIQYTSILQKFKLLNLNDISKTSVILKNVLEELMDFKGVISILTLCVWIDKSRLFKNFERWRSPFFIINYCILCQIVFKMVRLNFFHQELSEFFEWKLSND